MHFSFKWLTFLDGPEYDADRELDKAVSPKSLDRQDFLIKSLYIIYSYGLNKHEKKSDNFTTICRLYFPIKRNVRRNFRYRNGCNLRRSSNNIFNDQLNSRLRHSFLEIRKYLKNCKKKTLKRIALLCRDEPAKIKHNPKFKEEYGYVLDIIDTKIFQWNEVVQIIIRPENVRKILLLWCSVIRE